jgi:transcriptional regulator with XRE-family HTH domain
MDILSVIRRHNHTTYTLAKEMGIKQSSLSNILNGNPTVETLRKVADKIPCSVAEFFIDELPEGFDLAAARRSSAAEAADDQPPTEQELAPGVFVCPHCGAGVSFNTFVVKEPAEKKEAEHEQV